MFSDRGDFGTPTGIESFNCYAYAINQHRSEGRLGYKLQPGNMTHQAQSNRTSTSCPVLMERVLADNKVRGIRVVDPAATCPAGMYKIVAVQSTGQPDFHFLRQNGDVIYRMREGDTLAGVARELGVPRASVVSPCPDPRPGDLVFVRGAGTWSHKRGLSTGPLLRDARDRVIRDPLKANFDYGDLKYTRVCGAMCIRAASPKASPSEQKSVQCLLRKRNRSA